MEAIIKAPLIILLMLFPLWGILFPLKIIESTIVYIDPPAPSFMDFLRFILTGRDMVIIGAGWCLLLTSAMFLIAGNRRFFATLYAATAVFLGYSMYLFTLGAYGPIRWQLGLYILVAQGLMCAIARMACFGVKEFGQ